MKTNALKQVRLGRYIFAFALILIMVLIANLSGEKEIIFPEIAALAIGGWISEKQPWRVNKRKLFALMSLSSLFGILVVRYLPDILVLKAAVCFVFAAILLTFSRTSLVPVISACILPVYLNVSSVIYPISVTIMSLIIIIAQWQMEKHSMRPKNHYVPVEINLKEEFKKWAKLLVILLIVSIIPFKSRYLFLLAPPLIVTYVEFSNPNNPIRKHWLKIWAVISLAALYGTFVSYILNLKWHIPLVIGVSIALVVLFFTFKQVNSLFAPSGAIMLLPLLLSPSDLPLYPLEVALGAIILIGAAKLSFKKQKV